MGVERLNSSQFFSMRKTQNRKNSRKRQFAECFGESNKPLETFEIRETFERGISPKTQEHFLESPKQPPVFKVFLLPGFLNTFSKTRRENGE
jgi:hypothetical protein